MNNIIAYVTFTADIDVTFLGVSLRVNFVRNNYCNKLSNLTRVTACGQPLQVPDPVNINVVSRDLDPDCNHGPAVTFFMNEVRSVIL